MKRKLTKTELREINTGLPHIKKQLYENRELYQSICISVFEKPLKEEECWQIYDTDKKTIAERRKKLEDVLVDFFNLTDVYLWRHKRHYRILFYKPGSLQNLLRHCDILNQTWESGHRYDILLPEYSAVYSEEWDWTTIIWYRDYEKIKPLLEAVKKSGLYFYR
ncbi:hypothetical protein NAT51_05175 [Flavobacterium amniphilum]|uniref:hypothetical protein n=1 Tax=Flavobacterium amniphilum TaxID=1834035 RepID=UPI00202A275A|nr:hypothetical protein [Flavobacterium amniphilum]MCL9804900.1 hypothetical protein [Flavobacterium amniphilum]